MEAPGEGSKAQLGLTGRKLRGADSAATCSGEITKKIHGRHTEKRRLAKSRVATRVNLAVTFVEDHTIMHGLSIMEEAAPTSQELPQAVGSQPPGGGTQRRTDDGAIAKVATGPTEALSVSSTKSYHMEAAGKQEWPRLRSAPRTSIWEPSARPSQRETAVVFMALVCNGVMIMK